MSAHGPMPRSAWIFPALAVLLFAAATGLGYHLHAIGRRARVCGRAAGRSCSALYLRPSIMPKRSPSRIGEPYGTLLLTLAVTVIEVALIATIMLGEKPVPTLARDTVFAVVMIVCNGLVGVCILVGGLRYREQEFQVSGANLYLSVLIVMATITLIMPDYTLTTPGPIYSAAQLGFVSVVTVVLYGVFLYTQTIRHRAYFMGKELTSGDGEIHISNRMLVLSMSLLLVSLLAVVLLAKKFSLAVDVATALIGAPPAFAGILVALLILLPESVAADLRRAQERPAEEHQPGARLVAGDHRADDSGGRVGRLRTGQAIGAGAQCPGYGAAGVDVRPEHAHLRHRPHQHPVRAGSLVVFAVFVFLVFVP